ncbi:8715_t:CDS:1, partial [Racocetra persica]
EVAEIEPDSDDEETIMDYSASDIENEDEEEFEHIDNLDNSFGWILIWILRYQQRYRLPDTATESLVKFIHYLLTYLDQDQFKNFSKSLYLARKLMGLGLRINNYATCSACDRLYEPSKVTTKKPKQIPMCLYCTFVEFSNHIMSKMRQPCNQQLAKE